MKNAKRLLFQIDTKKTQEIRTSHLRSSSCLCSERKAKDREKKVFNDTGENEEKTGPKPACCMMCAMYCNSELE